MAAECYLCQGDYSSYRSASIVGSLAEPLGSCKVCNIFACGYHALRNSSLQRWECLICVPANIAPDVSGGSPPGNRPQGPVGGRTVAEEFEANYPTAHPDLKAAVREATDRFKTTVSRYFEHSPVNDWRTGKSFTFDDATEAFETVPTQAILPEEEQQQLAAAIAIIEYSGLDQTLLPQHLRRRPDLTGGIRTGETV